MIANIAVTTEEADALIDFLHLAVECFGPGGGDVIEEFGEARYDAVWGLALHAKNVTRER